MWWGGSEGGQGGSPPPDPPAEQGNSSQSGEDPAVIKQELGDLKDQFDEQQALIGHLKDMLKKKETTLTTREREVQDYASRLAKMKPRLGRGGRVRQSKPTEQLKSEAAAAAEIPDASVSQSEVVGAEAFPPPAPAEERVTPPLSAEERVVPPVPTEGRVIEEKKLSSSESSSRAKILLLRKQLQENRLKFQRQQKDDEKLAMEEMKQRIDRLRTDVEQRDDIIQSLQEGKGSFQDEPSMQKLYQQIVYKDNTILELSQKVTHLEGLLQEQQETLSEKDKIIEARTEAVSLIAKAQDEKGLKTLEELEEVRYQMKKMQEDFILKEQEMVAERDALSRELKDKVKKINQLEDNGRRLENLRFEMSTRNAELQEKIVALQSDTKALREQSEMDRLTYLEKDTLLQELKQKLVRAEAHGQKKLKALEKQLRGIKQDGNAGEQILELQNAIAELEEEKGNLQLKLVDFDDLKANNEKLASLRSKLEDHVKQLNCDLDSQLSAITQLETEKIKLVEGVNERENRIFDLESEMSSLKINLEEITQVKVTLDLRLCEVEEQRDTAEKQRVDLENQMSESGRAPVEQLLAEKGSLEESLQSVMKERDEWEQKYLNQIETVQECEEKSKSAIEEKDHKARECRRLMSILTDKENAIATLSIQIDKHDVVVAGIENKVKAANAEVEKRQSEIDSLNQNLQDHFEKLQTTHKTIQEMEQKLSSSASELQSKETELITIQGSVETLNRAVNERNITVQNLVGEVSGLQEQVRRKEKSVDDHIRRLEDLESLIKDRDANIDKLCDTVRNKDEQLSAKNLEIEVLKNDIANVSKQLETTKSSLESELDVLSTMLNDAKSQTEAANMDIEVKNSEIQNNQIIISKYEQEVCDKNQMMDNLQAQFHDIQTKLNATSSSLSEKEASVLKLKNELEEKTMYIEDLKVHQSSLEQKLLEQQEENKSINELRCKLEEDLNDSMLSVHQKEERISFIDNELTSKSNQHYEELESLKHALAEKESSITSLEAKVGSCTSELHSKVSEVEKWQQEALEKDVLLANKIQELEHIQCDSGSKDSVVADLQAQLTQNQEQISELRTQLHQVEGQLAESHQQLNQTQEQLMLTHNQLSQTQEHCKSAQEELLMNQRQLEETNTQYERVTALATQFEEQLRMKADSLEAAEKQMSCQEENSTQELKTIQDNIQHLQSEVTRLEVELKATKEQAEASQVESSQLKEWSVQLQNDYENIKSLQETSQQECDTAKQELDVKCKEALQLQQSFSELQLKSDSLQYELTQAITYQQQSQQQVISLQEELQLALNLKQQNESEIAALSVTQQQRISQLESDLLTLNQARDLLQVEFEKNNAELQTQTDTVNQLNVNIENLVMQASIKDGEIKSLQDKLSDKSESEGESSSLLRKLEEEKTQLEARVLELESLSPDLDSVAPDTSQELTKVREELTAALDQSRFLEEECDGLRGDANMVKQQLQDARQTITQLQTSLAIATQSQTSATASSGWDDWGEVDLGAPPASSSSVEVNPQQAGSLVTSLQKSLADKDEMLTMMQDQLKETLQEINTINDEKKILEKQKQNADSIAAQQLEQWKEDKEELDRLKSGVGDLAELQQSLQQEKEKVTVLEQDLLQKQLYVDELNRQLSLSQVGYVQGQTQDPVQLSETLGAPVASEVPGTIEEVATTQIEEIKQEETSLFSAVQWPQTGSEQDAASWFDQQVDAQKSLTAASEQAPVQGLDFQQAQGQEQDPASWFDQQGAVAEVQAVGEEVATTLTYEQQQQQQDISQVTQGQEAVNIEELQYKLSWYEEQWTTWTGHYTQLQTSHQEAEQKVAQLSQQLEELQGSTAVGNATVTPSDDTSVVKEGSQSFEESEPSVVSDTQTQEMQCRLINAEATLEQLKEENQALQLKASQVTELQMEIEKLQEAAQDPNQLQDAQAEIDQLRGFETQVYELQSQVQALQHQCTAMQNKLSEAETEVSRLREVEALYGELQSCIQESETKREGSKSRVQELELMVQSAESEIARLRNEIEVLNQAEQAAELNRESLQTSAEQQKLHEEVSEFSSQILKLQDEADRYQKEASLYKNEITKFQTESDCYKSEMARLENENQNMGDEMARARSDLQRMEQENSQLRSELEVLEGELDRMRSACEIYESENNRLRGDYEVLSQANQMTEAEKESLESEVQRITAQNMTLAADGEHLRDEIQRLTEVSTSAETEIVRLRNEMERFKSLDLQYNNLESKYNELQTQVASMESSSDNQISESEPQSLVVEEVDWSAEGRIEDEHIQRSSSVDMKYQEEIDNLKVKVIALEKEKNSLYDELQAAKLKSGKMLQKLKLTQGKNESLTKEIQKLKAKAGGFSDLDQALEDEWRAQVTKAESERDEFKQKLDEVESEKENLLTQVDVLTAAQEEFIEMKEDQDTTIKLLKTRNKEVEGQLQALEWKISELEEAVEQQQPGANVQEPIILPRTSPEREAAAPVSSDQSLSGEIDALKDHVTALQQEIKILKSENDRLQNSAKELEETVESLSNENESFQSIIEGLKEAKLKAESDSSNYKSVYIELHDEHESMKKEKEKTNEELRELTYTHNTLKAAYNSLYAEYNDLRDLCDSHKHDVGILKGERDRLVEEANSLKNQLEALHEEEEEETIRALQEECSSLREQNSLLHEENTALEVKTNNAVEKATRSEFTLEQNVEMQKLLQDELMKKSEEISFHTSTIEGLERQMTYMKAEMAALKTKLSQQDQAEESTLETTQELEKKVEQLMVHNQQLQIQVEAAETSLAKLAGGNQASSDAVVTPTSTTTPELEAALASLHLRDLRCQQLSLEITKLLEERDALQLKLSASLRQTQELTRELSLSHQLPAPVAPEPSLDQKLAELRELNDSLEQKALINLQGAAATNFGRRITLGGLPSAPIFAPHTAPPTPTATRHADYTLTREAQGTSSTLIDWIMGKSTPRVLHV